MVETLITRIRLSIALDLDPDAIHDHFVPSTATEEEFFLAWHAAKLLQGDSDGSRL